MFNNCAFEILIYIFVLMIWQTCSYVKFTGKCKRTGWQREPKDQCPACNYNHSKTYISVNQ